MVDRTTERITKDGEERTRTWGKDEENEKKKKENERRNQNQDDKLHVGSTEVLVEKRWMRSSLDSDWKELKGIMKAVDQAKARPCNGG